MNGNIMTFIGDPGELLEKISDIEYKNEELKGQINDEKNYWFLDYRFIFGVFSGFILTSIWQNFFS